MTDPGASPNAFEQDKPGTSARDRSEALIEALRRKGGVFVDVVRATRMPMVLTDPTLPGDPIVFANQAFLDLSGYGIEEVLGQSPHFMDGPDTDAADAGRFADILASDRDGVVETVQYAKGGRRFVATVLLSAFKDEHGKTLHYFLSWGDVTRRVDAEDERGVLRETQAALRDSERKYRTLFDAIDEGFCIIEVLFDDDGHPSDYRFLEANPAFEQQTGFVDAVGKRMRALAPEHEEHWFERYGRIARTGEPERFEDVAAALGRWYDVYAFRVGDPEDHRVAILFRDILQRRQAEVALQANEERQAFLLKLSDALRPLADAAEIQATTSRMMGEHLGLDRAMYAEVEGQPGTETGIIRGQYVRPPRAGEVPIEPFPPTFSFDSYGEHIMAGRRRGDLLVVDDIETAPGYEQQERDAWAAAGVRAAMVAPLVKQGRLVAEFGVHSAAPHVWTDTEKSLVREVAERSWAAAGRARAEAALRQSEEKYRVLFDTIDSGYALTDNVRDEEGRVVDLSGVDFNRSYTQHSGLPPFPGQRASEVITVEPEWLRQFEEVTRTGVAARHKNYIAERNRWVSTHYSLVGDLGSDRVAVVFDDITDRKRAEAALSESEERQTFLLKLSDALRPHTKALEIIGEATRLLGEAVGASRAYYAEWPPGTDYVEIQCDYAAPGLPSLVGRYPIEFFRYTDERFREGRTWVVDDAADGTIPAAERDYCLAHGVAAWVDVPLVKGSRLQAALFLVQDAPRHWNATEIALAEGTAERTWAAVERARAETASRESEERLREFGDASQDILWIRDAKTLQWTYLTPAFERIYGLTREEALEGDNYRNWLEMVVPEDRAHAETCVAKVRAGELVSFEYRIRRPDGGIRWLRDTDFPICDAAGKVVLFGGIGQDITGLKQAEAARSDSEQRLRLIVENARDYAIFTTDPEGNCTDWREGAEAVFGYSREEMLGANFRILFTPDDRAKGEPEKEMATAAAEGKASDVRWHMRKGGMRVFIDGVSTALRNENGGLIGFLKIGQDTTERHAYEQRQKLLLAELQHRVRNTLGMIRSMVRFTAEGHDDIEDYLSHLTGRLDSLSRTQQLLTRSSDARVDLHELVSDEMTAQAGGRSAYRLDGPPVTLAPKAAEVLSLALHELVTNSVKYGALGDVRNSGTQVNVRWNVTQRGEQDWLELRWRERAISAPAGVRRGFGTELITQRVPYELSGEASLDIGEHEVIAHIAFPLANGPASLLETGAPRMVTR